MTVKEVKSALANMKDDEEVKFVVRDYDYDGFPQDCDVDVIKIVRGDAERIRNEYGCYFYE